MENNVVPLRAPRVSKTTREMITDCFAHDDIAKASAFLSAECHNGLIQGRDDGWEGEELTGELAEHILESLPGEGTQGENVLALLLAHYLVNQPPLLEQLP